MKQASRMVLACIFCAWLAAPCLALEAGSRGDKAEDAAYWSGKVTELSDRLASVEGELDMLAAALESKMIPEDQEKAAKLKLSSLVVSRNMLGMHLSRAKFYRDIYASAGEDPALYKQYLKVLELKRLYEDELETVFHWSRDDTDNPLVIYREPDRAKREPQMVKARAARDRFEEENAKLGHMLQAFRQAREGGEGGGGGPCFPAGVLVLMADRSLRPIEHLVEGDMVLAKDFHTNRNVPARVIDILIGTDAFLVRINGDLRTNGAHRFYTDRSLKAARDIVPGDRLLGLGAPSLVARVERIPSAELAGNLDGLPLVQVYNITVEDVHTFYVSPDGDTFYLVHDSCGCAGTNEEE